MYRVVLHDCEKRWLVDRKDQNWQSVMWLLGGLGEGSEVATAYVYAGTDDVLVLVYDRGGVKI